MTEVELPGELGALAGRKHLRDLLGEEDVRVEPSRDNAISIEIQGLSARVLAAR
jgi:hypothetical protein